MKCSYCNNEINPGTEVAHNGLYFCNTLHRYSWNSNAQLDRQSGSQSIVSNQIPLEEKTSSPSTLRKILFGLLYSILFYFGILILFSAVVGGMAGVEAANAGKDSAEAGRIAGEEFGKKYGLIILLISISIAAIGSFTNWLPGTRKKKNRLTSGSN